MFLQVGEEFLVQNHAVFNDLGQAGAIFAGRAASTEQPYRSARHVAAKGADHVSGARQVDADFTADRTIDLGQ